MSRRRRIVRIALRLTFLTLLIPLGVVGWRWSGGNLGELGSGPSVIYRSRQLNAHQLSRTIRAHGIRTVLNLRGCNPDMPWYQQERAATLAAGATQVDVAMATDQWMSRVQLAAVVELLDTAPRPLLMHCQWGAERTGLVAAYAVLLREGGSLDEARAQFSPYYLYLPTADGRVMSGHVERYARWLDAQRLAHSPDRFRDWAQNHYRPQSPSREDWPYDPYPLVVVARADHPAAEAQAQPEPEVAVSVETEISSR